jgi:hypothetical protein
MQLSEKAISELRTSLRKSYGNDFDAELTDEQVNNIGVLALTCLKEGLKQEMQENAFEDIQK